jgi:hypothetical protein
MGTNTPKKGKRRYFEKAVHVAKTKQFIQCLKLRLEGLPEDEPLERPLCEIGYASDPTDRLNQHASHNISNYIMNLVESICKIYFPRCSNQQFVIIHIVHHTHAMYAEILSSRLGLCYIYQGGGFSHHCARISHGGVSDEDAAIWTTRQEELMKGKAFLEKIGKKIRRINEYANADEELLRARDKLDDMKVDLVCVAIEMKEKLKAVMKGDTKELGEYMAPFSELIALYGTDDEDVEMQ